jgi:hypothetical protein
MPEADLCRAHLLEDVFPLFILLRRVGRDELFGRLIG